MITLEEIENVSFRRAGLSGYKTDDVDAFVDRVVEKVRSLEMSARELEARVQAQEKEIRGYKEKEDSVQSAIITAEMTAKQIVMEATRKSAEQLAEADEKAEKVVREAQERADHLNAETDAKIEEVMNKALRESSEKIEENNRILEEQKKNVIRLMGEANKFRNTLLQLYKEHLRLINEMSKPEDIRKQQKDMDARYPEMHGNGPVALSEAPAAKQEEPEEVKAEPVEDTVAPVTAEVTESPKEETEEGIATEQTVAKPEDEVVFSGTSAQEEPAAEQGEPEEETVSLNSRTPITLVGAPAETSLNGSGRPEGSRSKKNGKNKKRR